MKSFVARLQKAGSFRTWRIIVNFWTLIFFATILFDFFNHNVLAENQVLLAVAAIYAAALALYSAEKEFRRWRHIHSAMHPGEIYAIFWTILVIFLVVGDVLYNMAYHMPAEVSASYIAVISILAITRESKNAYKRRKGKK